MAGVEVRNVHDGFLLVDKGILNRLQQTRLIAFDRQQIIRLLADDLAGYCLLTPHGIDADQKALEIEGVEQFWNGRDLVAFARHLLLPEHQPQFRRKGADHVDRLFAARTGTAHRFTIDGDRSIQLRDHLTHPTPEAGLKTLRVEQAKDAQERVLRRNAVLERHEPPQPAFVHARPFHDRASALELNNLFGISSSQKSLTLSHL
jgi:hypothetical protein